MLRRRAVLSGLFAFVSFSLFIVGGTITGCSKDATVSKAEEERFKNPPKEMPKEAVEYMQKHGSGSPPAGAK